ncbi:DUF2020 domain-containing protein [Corynebacterium crudilactis]|uniref:DUF2020 domain-containing protein n=1 Tax=Corynebacterium crudilactis TaxID=1652495 RepID=A0A172QWR1_9CORY|nr:DUF2020 domain-containing protein [Corynebacterium crudilactis]ANE05091.1 hypothetical protein ccrud_13370 [Corynebacterium crudilactis]
MRRTLPTFLLASIMLTACAAQEPAEVTTLVAANTSTEVPEISTDGLPIDALPAVARTAQTACPYLDTTWVADTNGQRVTGYGTDERFSTPSCVFYSFPEEPQLTVIIREMATVDDAIAVVDWAAPIDSTEPAEEPLGWSGGRRGGNTESGALYAVQKDKTAVIVFTNQDQSLKAQLIAEETIQNLGL